MIVSRPIRFTGSEDERRANQATHRFVSFDPDDAGRCVDCDCNSFGVAKDYPCGAEVPRETVNLS